VDLYALSFTFRNLTTHSHFHCGPPLVANKQDSASLFDICPLLPSGRESTELPHGRCMKRYTSCDAFFLSPSALSDCLEFFTSSAAVHTC